jgi:flagellar biosynthesis/type III secretory pathway protein FliH
LKPRLKAIEKQMTLYQRVLMQTVEQARKEAYEKGYKAGLEAATEKPALYEGGVCAVPPQ